MNNLTRLCYRSNATECYKIQSWIRRGNNEIKENVKDRKNKGNDNDKKREVTLQQAKQRWEGLEENSLTICAEGRR